MQEIFKHDPDSSHISGYFHRWPIKTNMHFKPGVPCVIQVF